jgi:hypothetical protein
LNLRDQILGASDAKVIPLEVPEWGCKVHLRVMSGSERDRFEASTAEDKRTGRKNLDNIRARFAVLVLCDEKGERLFADGDAAALGKKSAAALDRILEEGSRLNGIGEQDVRELEGKSASGQSVDSGTSSP